MDLGDRRDRGIKRYQLSAACFPLWLQFLNQMSVATNELRITTITMTITTTTPMAPKPPPMTPMDSDVYRLPAIPGEFDDYLRPSSPITWASNTTTITTTDFWIVQFSHYSVKEFLTSSRLGSSRKNLLSRFHVSPEPAHTSLAPQVASAPCCKRVTTSRNPGLSLFLATQQETGWITLKFNNVAPRIRNWDGIPV